MLTNVRRIGANALSVLSSDVMNRATSFVLYAMVARHLGTREFGQLSLALTLFYTFQVLALGGLKTLIIREVAKDRTQTAMYFTNGSLIVVHSTLIAIAVLWAVLWFMRYSADTTSVILSLSLGLFPYTISAVCEGIFQAWECMHYIAYVNVPSNLSKIVAAYVLLSMRRELHAVVFVLVAALGLGAAVELAIVLHRFPSKGAAPDWRFSLATASAAITFLGIDGTTAILTSMNILLLSKLATETEVGLYSAAVQLMVPLLLVYQSMAQSIFPIMCRHVEPGLRSLKHIAEQAMEILLVLALPAACGLFFLGRSMLALLFRSPVFVQAFPALRIIAWVLILQVFTSILGQALVASHNEKVTFRIVVVDTLFNFLIGWPLISWYGLRGAAFTMLLMRAADFSQHYISVFRLLRGIALSKIIWKPLLAATVMVGFLLSSPGSSRLITGVSAVLIYGAVLLLAGIWASGGYQQFIDKFRPAFTD